jgi:hypothetical protein
LASASPMGLLLHSPLQVGLKDGTSAPFATSHDRTVDPTERPSDSPARGLTPQGAEAWAVQRQGTMQRQCRGIGMCRGMCRACRAWNSGTRQSWGGMSRGAGHREHGACAEACAEAAEGMGGLRGMGCDRACRGRCREHGPITEAGHREHGRSGNRSEAWGGAQRTTWCRAWAQCREHAESMEQV